ncbi:amino acid permease [Croceibacterium aestuarii]|uniref:amino acid permease n=1 Tax=Croceibacterium aestuarii TaxID=3064139 RepID=UPI00272E5C73|nr:amino acid permease [Croceibacterium sp. D39]
MILDRVKPLDAILAAAEKKSLKRTLGWFQLMLFGIGCVIGTGIFVLTSVGAQKAGPGLMLAFAIAGAVCIVAALCYAEIAAMIPVAGSAYTYSYATMGEFFAWTVGWALIMEYAIAASAVSVGWSGYFSGTVLGGLGIHLPTWLSAGPLALGGVEGGFINLPALVIALLVTALLVIGTSESAKVNAILVLIKVTALTAFVAITLTSSEFDAERFNPFLPAGVFGGFGTGVGAVGAAATMFFAYVGFDAVSTAAEETKNPQRNVPIGLVGSLLFCTVFYILVAAGAIGTIGGTPIFDPSGTFPLETGSPELARQCAMPEYAQSLVCSKEPLAHVLKVLGFTGIGNLIGLAAFLALPSVILVLIFGQTRIFFVMSRDGLLPEKLSSVHPKFRTPHVVTLITGVAVAIAAAFFPVGQLADISNAGTLYAFLMVAVAVLVLRKTDANRPRSFRVPAVWVIAPLTIFGCVFLFLNLPAAAMLFLPVWGALGLVVYFLYSRSHSHLGRGIVEVVDDVAGEETQVPIHPPKD